MNESDADDPMVLREKSTDIYIGARYFKTEPRLTLSLPIGDPITTVSTDDRWDPFVGFRTGRELSKRVYFIMGYRALGFDTVTGDGENRNGADLVQHGPMIGGGFLF